MLHPISVAPLLVSLAAAASDMGPAAFFWPPDRAWGPAQDNTPPCGSSEGVTNRTQFPISNGAVAIVLQDESFNVNLAISYSNNPTSNSAFTALIPGTDIKEILPGHECYALPNPPSTITAGSNATIQLMYTSTYQSDPSNQTFYACADITYVDTTDFKTNVPCFNVSVPAGSTMPSSSHTPVSSSSAELVGKKKGMSGGAIAGAVIGGVLGAAVLFGAGFVLFRRWRRRVRRERAVALRMNELTNPAKRSGSEGSGERIGA